jgi:hypothetical protein
VRLGRLKLELENAVGDGDESKRRANLFEWVTSVRCERTSNPIPGLSRKSRMGYSSYLSVPVQLITKRMTRTDTPWAKSRETLGTPSSSTRSVLVLQSRTGCFTQAQPSFPSRNHCTSKTVD